MENNCQGCRFPTFRSIKRHRVSSNSLAQITENWFPQKSECEDSIQKKKSSSVTFFLTAGMDFLLLSEYN